MILVYFICLHHYIRTNYLPLGTVLPVLRYHWYYLLGATEDAINAAREAFHAHLAATQKTQPQSHDTSEEDLSQLDERELDVEFAGQ